MTPDYDRAATLALITLLRLGVESLPVFPETLIRQCKNTRLLTYQEYCALPGIASRFPSTLSSRHPEALTHLFEFHSGKVAWLVYYDPKMMSPERRKFSLAHELGHIVLRHHGRSEEEEQEADFFAAHLLLPRPALAEFVQRGFPLLEVNLYNLSNVSRACLYTIQQSPSSWVEPSLNTRLRAQLLPAFNEQHIWDRPHGPARYINIRSYMSGYREE